MGAGLMGKQYLERLVNHHHMECVGIVSPSSDSNVEVAKKYSLPLFTDLKQASIELEPDGVLLASPNEFHFEQTAICVNLNLPVLVEKPFITDINQGEDLLKLINNNNAKVLVGHHRMHSSIMRKAKEIVDSGVLGRIVSFRGSAQFYKPDDYFVDGPWRTLKGGGPLMLNMIHEVSNMRALCGEVSEVQAITSNAIRGYEVEDTAVINLKFENGSVGSFVLSDTAASWESWELTAGENKAYPYYPDKSCYSITGTLGSLSIPNMQLNYFGKSHKKSWWTAFQEEWKQYHRDDPLLEQLAHFDEMIRLDVAPKVSANDGLINVKLIEAIKLAAIKGVSIKCTH